MDTEELRNLFSQPEFNVRDGLDTYDGNYRCFAELGDVVTSDLRHRFSQRESATREAFPEETHRPTRAQADPAGPRLAPEKEEVPSPRVVRYVSRGRVLVAGPNGRAEEAVSRLPRETPCWTHERVTRVAGYLGRFRAWDSVGDQEVDLAGRAGVDAFDVILDLQDPPFWRGAFLPPGYFSPGGDGAALDSALSEIPSLSGEFEREHLIRYRSSRCEHGWGRLRGCTRCIDVCPAGALQGAAGRVQLDPHLCHACGACCAACPTKALSNEAPWLELLLRHLQERVSRRSPLVLWGIPDGEPKGLDEGSWLGLPMNSLWAAGPELWLTALAAGAPALRVAVPPEAPGGLAEEVSRQIAVTTDFLRAVGQPEDAVGLWTASDDAPGEVASVQAPTAVAAVWDSEDPRDTVRRALSRLRRPEAALPESVALPEGAPFGEVILDSGRCTLCMACTGVCRSSALVAGPDRPRLGFREANCTQCGLCEGVCPESALTLRRRYHFEAQSGGERTLHEEDPFACVRCGAPFATRKIVERVAAGLLGHWMYAEEKALRRVRMCRTCRIVDRFEEESGAGAGEARP